MPVNVPPTLSFYAQPGNMTSAGRYVPMFDSLPRDIAGLATVTQGLLVHEHIAAVYGVKLSDEDRATVHIRPVEDLLGEIVARDDRPLDTARPVQDRLAGNCRHSSVLMVAMLRAHGMSARARCGFGGYFETDSFEDHWVCEYWHAGQERWVLVDAQLDDRQREMFLIDFDATDVPRDRFLTAGEAWTSCRTGAADPEKFGLSLNDQAGFWWIAGNLMRDAAALGNLELLPWDCWGAMPAPDEEIDEELGALFDRLAVLTQTPDSAFTELMRLFREDERLLVPPTVHNAVRNRTESI